MKRTKGGQFKNRFSDSQIDKMVLQHKNGKSVNAISLIWNCSKGSVREYFKKRKCYVPRSECASGKYDADYGFFNRIDNEEKAYWLGFLAADGSVSSTKKGCYVNLSLKWSDLNHLELFKKSLKSTHEIKKVYGKTKNKIHEKCSITIYSRKMITDLINHGIVPRKTFALEFPEWLDDEYIRHYIRGYFDGDGSWIIDKKLNKYFYPRFSFVGNEKFIEKLKTIIMQKCNIEKILIRNACNNPNVKRLECAGIKKNKLFYDFLYKDCNLYMARKKEKVEQIFKDYFITMR